MRAGWKQPRVCAHVHQHTRDHWGIGDGGGAQVAQGGTLPRVETSLCSWRGTGWRWKNQGRDKVIFQELGWWAYLRDELYSRPGKKRENGAQAQGLGSWGCLQLRPHLCLQPVPWARTKAGQRALLLTPCF